MDGSFSNAKVGLGASPLRNLVCEISTIFLRSEWLIFGKNQILSGGRD